VGLRQGQPLAWHISQNGSASRFAPPPTHQISDGEAMIEAAVAGLGLCQMPYSLLRQHVEAGRLVTLLEAYNDTEVPIYLIWPTGLRMRPKARYLIDILVEMARAGRFD
jgi:DNA-binding transcriptional LysR family regulator